MTLLSIKISQKYEVAGEKKPWHTGTCIVSWHDLYPNRRKNIFIKTSTFCSYWHIWYKVLSHKRVMKWYCSTCKQIHLRNRHSITKESVRIANLYIADKHFSEWSGHIKPYFGNHLIMHTLNFISLIKETNERELHWKFSPKLILKHLKSRFIGSKLNLLAQVWKELLS